jgi:hypothetical protein
MWINPMLSIWLYTTIGSLVFCTFALWKWYGGTDGDDN